MLSQKSMIIFYSVCGVVVAWMLFRIWRKNRVANAGKTPSTRPASKTAANPAPAAPAPTASSAAKTASVVPSSASTSRTSASTTPETITSSTPEPSPVQQVTRPAYLASSTLRTDAGRSEVSSWEDRRLLETHGMAPRSTNQMPRVLPEEIPGVDDSDRSFGSALNPAFASLLPESDVRREEARKDLMAAGYYNPHAVENLAATRYVLMMLGMVFFGALLLIVPPRLEPWMVSGCILAPLLGWSVPALYIRGKAKERRHQIERAMPDLLDMLNMCVSQGLTVPDSLLRIGRDFRPVYPELSQELSIVNEQSKISNMHTALESFSRRIDMPEVHSLTSLLIQTERMGTSISQALATYSDTMRENQRQQADEKGNRATFRLLFPTVLCLMPAVYLFLLGPAVNELQKFFYGGGADSLNSGSQVVQRINATRARGRAPNRPTAPFGQ